MLLTEATLNSPVNTSKVNITPAMGALNVAAMPPAAPALTRARSRDLSSFSSWPSDDPAAAPIWTIGPSRPADPPDPMVSAEATVLTRITTGRIRPPVVSMAVMTSGTPCPLASGAKKCTSGPTMRPPMMGRTNTYQPPRDEKTWAPPSKKRRWHSEMISIKATAPRPVTAPMIAARPAVPATGDDQKRKNRRGAQAKGELERSAAAAACDGFREESMTMGD